MADRVVMVSSEAEARAQLAEEMAELSKNPPSKTVPGGKYRVGGVEVDASGKPLKASKEDKDAAQRERQDAERVAAGEVSKSEQEAAKAAAREERESAKAAKSGVRKSAR